MQPTETPSNKPIPKHLKYQRVLDNRKQKIRGLWVRNGRYSAQLTIPDPITGVKAVRRVKLEITNEAGILVPVQTVAEAVNALKRLQTQREDGEVPTLGKTPKFCDYVKDYLTRPVTLNKQPKTIQTETGHLNAWIKHLGETRLNRITAPMIAEFRNKRLKEVSGRTVNLAVGALRVVLREAINDGILKRLPTENMRALKHVSRKKDLVALSDIEKICAAAMEVSKNGQQFKDYLMFMTFTGARCSQTLLTKWTDIDWVNNQVKVPRQGKGKAGGIVDFNPELESHLKDMLTRKAPDSDYLFPSPQRGKKDIASKTFRETLKLARDKAGFPKFAFHHCRHFFISYAVMNGTDYMTIAKWVGHNDGGILIAKVYGHISNEHAQTQAAKLRFAPVIIATPDSKVA
jgi:integrase